MDKKKIVTTALSAVMVIGATVGGTLAFLTDSDEETNTFTVGDVEIDLIESQYHRVNAGMGNATGKTEPIIGGYLWAADVDLQGNEANTPDVANASWTGTYFSDEQILADAETYKDQGGYFEQHSELMVPGCNVRKNPYVQNTGSSPAYIRVRALVPQTLFKLLDNGLSMWNSTALEDGVASKAVEAYYDNYDAADANLGMPDEFLVERNGIKYYEFDFTYPEPLAAGELTFWNVWGNIAIDKNATNEDLENVDSFDVIFEADAIQSQGFASAADAFAAFDA